MEHSRYGDTKREDGVGDRGVPQAEALLEQIVECCDWDRPWKCPPDGASIAFA